MIISIVVFLVLAAAIVAVTVYNFGRKNENTRARFASMAAPASPVDRRDYTFGGRDSAGSTQKVASTKPPS